MRFEWGFNYSGPREARVEPGCVTCAAGTTQRCPTHGENYAKNCAHCASAQGKPCQAHWGLEAALEGHRANVEPDALADYDLAANMILAEGPSKKRNIDVRMRGHGTLADRDERELEIAVRARP